MISGLGGREPRHESRGSGYSRLGRFEEAVQDYTVVIDLDPENDLEYFNRGIAYHYLEPHEEVVKDLTRAVDLDPTTSQLKLF